MTHEVLVVSRRTQRLLCDINGIICDKLNSGGESPPTVGMSHVEAAGIRAAIEDGIMPPSVMIKASPLSILRRGQWTEEEEAYSNRLIAEFKAGTLPLMDGTTLRTFLSKVLNCDPMRISKKFVGDNCIGKQSFRRNLVDAQVLNAIFIELIELERVYFEKVAEKKSRLSLKDDISNNDNNQTFDSFRDPVGRVVRHQQQNLAGQHSHGIPPRIPHLAPSAAAASSGDNPWSVGLSSGSLELQLAAGRIGPPPAIGGIGQVPALPYQVMSGSASKPVHQQRQHQQLPGYNPVPPASASTTAFSARAAATQFETGGSIYPGQRVGDSNCSSRDGTALPVMGLHDSFRSQFDGYPNQGLDYASAMRQRYDMSSYAQSQTFNVYSNPHHHLLLQQQHNQQQMYGSSASISMHPRGLSRPAPSASTSASPSPSTTASSAPSSFDKNVYTSSGVLSAAASLAALSSMVFAAPDSSSDAEPVRSQLPVPSSSEQIQTRQQHHHQYDQQEQLYMMQMQDQSETDGVTDVPSSSSPSPSMYSAHTQQQHRQYQAWQGHAHIVPSGSPAYFNMGATGPGMAGAPTSAYHPHMSNMPYQSFANALPPSITTKPNYYMGNTPYGHSHMNGYFPIGGSSHGGAGVGAMYSNMTRPGGGGVNSDAFGAMGVADRGIKRPR